MVICMGGYIEDCVGRLLIVVVMYGLDRAHSAEVSCELLSCMR